MCLVICLNITGLKIIVLLIKFKMSRSKDGNKDNKTQIKDKTRKLVSFRQ
jgi:hypothetical protein